MARSKIIVPDYKHEQYKGVEGQHIDHAVDASLDIIEQERKGRQLGLYTRWGALNVIQGKYFRFNEVNLIASLSGHGKSFVANMIVSDFSEVDPIVDSKGSFVREGLNQHFEGEIVILYFGLEQPVEDEIARSLSRITKKSYTNLLSSEFDPASATYNRITDEEYEFIKSQSRYLRGRPIYYFTEEANHAQIWETCVEFKRLNPKKRFVIVIDHDFLIQRAHPNQTNSEYVTFTARLLLMLRKKLKAMVFALHQMNAAIQGIDRLTKPQLHYPQDSDIYFVNEIKWACDNVYIFPYSPEKLNIPVYSPYKIKTQDLIVCSKLKSRKGLNKELYFEQMFAKGTLKYLGQDELNARMEHDN